MVHLRNDGVPQHINTSFLEMRKKKKYMNKHQYIMKNYTINKYNNNPLEKYKHWDKK